MTDVSAWNLVNRRLVATSLGELSYEQILKPVAEANGVYQLVLPQDIRYSFEAWRGVWDHLRVKPESIVRQANGKSETVSSAAQFFIDIQNEIAVDDIVLANFLEEMHNSLYSEMAIWEKQKKHSIAEMLHWSGEKIQTILSGHPKLLLNKGRIGWGADDLAKYAPEHEAGVQLQWLAIEKNSALSSVEDMHSLLSESLDPAELARFERELKNKNILAEKFVFVPVHPWQWQRFIQVQFAGEIALGTLVPLGSFGDTYRPQISLRTLSNVSRPERLDIKLPITVLNTSAFRGIAAKYIPLGPPLSRAIAGLCQQDPVLKAARTEVLSERAGVSFQQPDFAKIAGAPYRYHEYLGAIWRESTPAKLAADEKALIAGSLFYQDPEGKSLIGALIKASALTAKEWLRRYFQVVVVPLYHLQVNYGLGLVAHGQNVVLRLKNNAPAGLLLKDFQGDLRLCSSNLAWAEKNLEPVAKSLTQLPPDYLIHDLITGHFVTVLRFISETLQESDQVPEAEFYQILAEVLKEYLKQNPRELAKGQDLFAEKFPRVVVNKVRFKIGYADSSERPVPLVAQELENPILAGWKKSEDFHG